MENQLNHEKYFETLRTSFTNGESICRFCLKIRHNKSQKFVQINDEIKENYRALVSKEMEVGKGMNISLSWLCVQCEHSLQGAVNLLETIINGEETFKKFLNQLNNLDSVFHDNVKHESTSTVEEELGESFMNGKEDGQEDFEVIMSQTEEWLEEDYEIDVVPKSNSNAVSNNNKIEEPSFVDSKLNLKQSEEKIHQTLFIRKKRLLDYESMEGYSEKITNAAILFQCTRCDIQFTTRVSLRKHFRESTKHSLSSSEREAICDVCNEILSNTANLKRHKRMVHDSVIIKCKFCEKTGNKYYIETHTRLHHSEKKFICDICDVRFSIFSKMRAHILGVHKQEGAFKCQYCSESFMDSWQRISHVKKIHAKEKNENGKYLCPKCAMKCGSKQGLQLHIQACGNIRQQARQLKERLQCPLCCHKFVQQEKLDKHLEEHAKKNKPRPYACLLCPATYGKKSHLKNHIMRAHTTMEHQKYKCQYCNKGFPFPKEKDLHERYHTKEEFPNKCHECGKSFLTKTILGRHLRIHSDTRKLETKCFYCRFCKTRLIELENLVNHIKKYHAENYDPNVKYETWADGDK